MAFAASLARDNVSSAGDDVVSIWRERQPAFWGERKPGFFRATPLAHPAHHASPRFARRDPSLSVAKRSVDVLGAGLALVFFAPFLIAIATAIKATSPGPILFSQARYGYRNRRFVIYKFRTMRTDLEDRTGTRQTIGNDPRITPVGRLLRRTSLDELPQLLNVLKGDMALVGPRPHVPRMLAASMLYEDLIPYYFQRHSVRPGITGLAQVRGCRGSTAEAQPAISRIDYDLEYIETWSFWKDMMIVVKTIRREFLSGHGT